MFHFRLPIAEKMALNHLILCSLPVRNILTCRYDSIASKPTTCHGVDLFEDGSSQNQQIVDSKHV